MTGVWHSFCAVLLRMVNFRRCEAQHLLNLCEDRCGFDFMWNENWVRCRLSRTKRPQSDYSRMIQGREADIGVCSGWRRNRIISSSDHYFGHVNSPVSNIWTHPSSDMCDRSSGAQFNSAFSRCFTAFPSRAVADGSFTL